jgi:alkanesulfonate monooxygenase SsuD/methylene tetrahydromethanopterin reductase-like flavin-dependent oxidoreductase (luciferase family)
VTDLEQLRRSGGVRLGLCLPTFAWPGPTLFRTPGVREVDPTDVLDLAREADDLGLDSLWVCDHLMLGRDAAVLEGWTTLSAVAAVTRRARIGLIHQATAHRPPAIAAKMMATLDQISGGRFVYFPDMGTFADEQVAYGLDWSPDVEERVARVAEAIGVSQALWSADGPIDQEWPQTRLVGARATPRPKQPHPAVWLGETHPAQLRLCAARGTGWNSSPVSVPELRLRLDQLRRACDEAGRDVAEIEVSLEAQVLVADSHDEIRAQLAELTSRPGFDGQELAGPPVDGLDAYLSGATDVVPAALADTWLIGTPQEVAQRVRELRAVGLDHLMLWFADVPSRSGLRLFMDRVAPAVRGIDLDDARPLAGKTA